MNSKIHATHLSAVLLIGTLFSFQTNAQDEIKPSMWIPKSAKEHITKGLETSFMSGILAEKNDSSTLRSGAIATVNKFDDYLWKSDVDKIIAYAPSFRTPGFPPHEEQKLEAMGRYQMCNALFTILLPPNHQPSTTDLHFAFAAGLTMSSMAVFFIQNSRDKPMSTFEQYATSEEMAVLMERMQKEQDVLAAFAEDCTGAMEPFSQAIE